MRTLQHLATTLRARIAQLGLTQEALSTEAGVSRQTLSKVLSGRADLKVTTLFALADRLGIEIVMVPKEIAPSIEPLDDARPRVKSMVEAALETVTPPGQGNTRKP